MSGTFLLDLSSIVLTDVVLGGDNALVISLATRSLPPRERRIGLIAGAGGAVVLRVVLTFFAATLLQLNYIKLIGGAVILWIAVKLLTDGTGEEAAGIGRTNGLAHAIRVILVADVTMSLDNILAVAALSKGNLTLLVIGLLLSISFVVFTSTLLSQIMDRYPIVVWAGAAILGRVGGNMMTTDPFIRSLFHPTPAAEIGAEIFCAVAVVVAGALLRSGSSRSRSPGS